MGDALREIESCNKRSKTEEANMGKNRQRSVENARSLHAACREAEKALYDHNLTHSASYCVRLDKFLNGAGPLEIVAGSIRDSSVRYVKWASSTNMCSHTKVTELDNGCTASEAELADKKIECSSAQRSFESEFCSWKAELEANCKQLDTCYSTTGMAMTITSVRREHLWRNGMSRLRPCKRSCATATSGRVKRMVEIIGLNTMPLNSRFAKTKPMRLAMWTMVRQTTRLSAF